MRKILALAALSALTFAVAPAAIVNPASAQTSTTTTASQPNPTWEKIKGNWNVAKGHIKEQWGKLTDDDLTAIEGRRDILVGRIQRAYGVTEEQASKQVSDWEVKYNR